MTLLVLCFLAGILTIAAPCVFTLLPVIVGGSVARSGSDARSNTLRPIIITASLAVSIIIFTLLLKATTSLLGVPQQVWQIIAGLIVIGLGANFLAPKLWTRFAASSGAHEKSNKLLGKAYFKKGYGGDVLTGAALGPVFSSCSPTYAFVVASILPTSFIEGMAYLLAYVAGLSITLLLIAYAGQTAALKLGWLADPSNNFRKVIGVLFIIVGASIILGLDKKLEAGLVESGALDWLVNFENRMR